MRMSLSLAAESGKGHTFPFSRRVFDARAICTARTRASKHIREAERRKARTERPLRAIRALPPGRVRGARLPFFPPPAWGGGLGGGRARLPALYRGSRQRPLGLRLRPPPGQPAPGRPAS